MSVARFKVKKFDSANNFGLWRIKMKTLLLQYDLKGAIKEC